jgi:hypothetical protein
MNPHLLKNMAETEQLREQAGRQAELDWVELIEVVTELTREIEAEQAAGTEPFDPRMRELARQWRALIDHFTGGERGGRLALAAPTSA